MNTIWISTNCSLKAESRIGVSKPKVSKPKADDIVVIGLPADVDETSTTTTTTTTEAPASGVFAEVEVISDDLDLDPNVPVAASRPWASATAADGGTAQVRMNV